MGARQREASGPHRARDGAARRWAGELALSADERRAWHDVGDVARRPRDAPEPSFAVSLGDPAADPDPPRAGGRERLSASGKHRIEVLEAIRWHTFGSAHWGRTGRALYMADFLEPGRPFSAIGPRVSRGAATADFDGVFRQVVRQRLEWTVREGTCLSGDGRPLEQRRLTSRAKWLGCRGDCDARRRRSRSSSCGRARLPVRSTALGHLVTRRSRAARRAYSRGSLNATGPAASRDERHDAAGSGLRRRHVHDERNARRTRPWSSIVPATPSGRGSSGRR